VIEALCEIFFVGSEWNSTIPGLLLKKIEKNYPQTNELQQVQANVTLSPTSQGAQFQSIGVRTQFINQDKSRMIQLEQELVVINQLKPYIKFKDWCPEIYSIVNYYSELAKPKGIKKIGVRYINEISLPLQVVSPKMEEYFRIYPNVPMEFGSMHGRFMLRMELPSHHKGHELVVTLATKTGSLNEKFSFLFDIYDMMQFEQPISLNELSRVVSDAHDNVVLAFENGLTEETKTLFEEGEK